MKQGRSEIIEIRLGDADVAISQLREGLRGKGKPQWSRAEIAPLMRVALIADPEKFAIQSVATADQHIRPGHVARWDFDVTPLRSGRQRLRVLVSMRVKFEGKDEVVDLPSLEREVRVIVAPLHVTGRFCAKNWQWVAGTVAIPIFYWAANMTGFMDAAGKHIKDVLK